MMRRAVAVAVLTLASATAGSQPPDPDRIEQLADRLEQRERFNLFNDCDPMQLTIRMPRRDLVTVVGTLSHAVQNAAESRLRAGRLFTDAVDRDLPSLFVRILPDFTSDLYIVGISYSKPLRDPATGLTEVTSTWRTERKAPDDDPAILNALSQLLDRFLAAYLRVNEDACE